MLAHMRPSRHGFTIASLDASLRTKATPALCLGLCPRPPGAQSPFAWLRRYPHPGWCHPPPQRALPLRHRSYGLMRRTKILLPTRLSARTPGLCRLLPVPAGRWPFPMFISASPPSDAWTRTPVGLLVRVPVASQDGGSLPAVVKRSASHKNSWTATSVQRFFSGLQPFASLPASEFACHPGRSHPAPDTAEQRWRLRSSITWVRYLPQCRTY